MWNKAHADHRSVEDRIPISRVRTLAALALLLALGLAAAGSAIARPFHPAVGQAVHTDSRAQEVAPPIDPNC